MYTSLLIPLIWIKPSSTPMIIEGSPLCVQLGFSQNDVGIRNSAKWWVLYTRQYDLFAFLPESKPPWQSQPLPPVFPGYVSSVLAWIDFSDWNKTFFLEVSYSAVLPPSLANGTERLLNAPSSTCLHSWSLGALCCGNTPKAEQGVYCESITDMELFLIIEKDAECYFYLFKPIWTSSAHQIFFLIKAVTNSCWLMSFTAMRSISIASGQRKAFPCPFCIPVAVSLGWCSTHRKPSKARGNFVLERASVMKCRKHQ